MVSCFCVIDLPRSNLEYYDEGVDHKRYRAHPYSVGIILYVQAASRFEEALPNQRLASKIAPG